MADLPHYSWPLRFAAAGFAVCDQDSDEDLRSRAAVVASTPRGWRHDDPSFGVSDPTFTQGAIDADRIASEIAQSDQGLDLTAEEIIDLRDAMNRTVTVTATRATSTEET